MTLKKRKRREQKGLQVRIQQHPKVTNPGNKNMNRNKPSPSYTHILHVSDEMQNPPPNVLHSHNDVDMGFSVPLESLNQAEGRTLVSGIVLTSVNIL